MHVHRLARARKCGRHCEIVGLLMNQECFCTIARPIPIHSRQQEATDCSIR